MELDYAQSSSDMEICLAPQIYPIFPDLKSGKTEL